jgi:phage gpG-like protein
MGKFALDFDDDAVVAFLRGAGPVAKDIERRAINVVALAKQNASGRPGPNVDTGRLRASISYSIDEGAEGVKATITANAEYASFVELGTASHDIRPVNKEALFWPGAPYPVAIVHHPGSKPYPFLKPALVAAVV